MIRPTFFLAAIVTLLFLDPANALDEGEDEQGSLRWSWRWSTCRCRNGRIFSGISCNSGTCANNCISRGGIFGCHHSRHIDCIAADSVLFSCSSQSFVTADSIIPGDHIRTLSSEDGSSICSEVFYTFMHEGTSHALEVKLEDSSKVTVSDNHLLYLGSSFESRQAQMAKNVKVGDMLVSSDGSAKKIISIKDTTSELVNVLTMEGSLELENSIVISTHSFHETLYSAVFYPIKMAYKWIGAHVVKKAEPYLLETEALFKPYFAMIADSM